MYSRFRKKHIWNKNKMSNNAYKSSVVKVTFSSIVKIITIDLEYVSSKPMCLEPVTNRRVAICTHCQVNEGNILRCSNLQ